MKEINGYLLVSLPDNFRTYGLGIAAMNRGLNYIAYDTPNSFVDERIVLPKGNYSIIGLAKDLTEEQWKGIVESKKTFGYRKHDAVNGEYQWTARALQSGHSLLKANNLNPNTTLILKQVA